MMGRNKKAVTRLCIAFSSQGCIRTRMHTRLE